MQRLSAFLRRAGVRAASSAAIALPRRRVLRSAVAFAAASTATAAWWLARAHAPVRADAAKTSAATGDSSSDAAADCTAASILASADPVAVATARAAAGLGMPRSAVAAASVGYGLSTAAAPRGVLPAAALHTSTAAGVVDTIGWTPLLELRTLSDATGCRILAKAEHLNPGGSVKDRAAKWMVLQAEADGLLVPHSTPPHVIVEGTGGNTGIGLALLARARGYRAIFTMPTNVSSEKVTAMRDLGAETHVVPAVPFTDPKHFMHLAKQLAIDTPGSFFTNQFDNASNALAHYHTTGPEIWSQAQGNVDGLCVAAGTGGTISGLSNYLKERNPRLKSYLIDCSGSGLHSYVRSGEFKSDGPTTVLEGIGIGRKTVNFELGKPLVDGAFQGSDREAVEMAHYLLKHEGLFVGPSAALNVAGAVKLARVMGPGHTVVTVLCDGGDRYRTKTWNADFLRDKGLTPRSTDDHTLQWIH